jgi:hypothetical protein
MEAPVKQAGLFWGSVLRTLGYAGIFAPNGVIYLLPKYFNNSALRRHEQRHAMQCQRDGYFTFWFLIFWYLLWYGYWNSPYEIEARGAEHPDAIHGMATDAR